MMLRSMLFVPADSERKLARAAGAGADALILDLEDSVLPDRKPAARVMARDYLLSHATASSGTAASGRVVASSHAVASTHVSEPVHSHAFSHAGATSHGTASGHAPGTPLWVRINDLASGELLTDLAAVMPARPAGIILPKIRGPEDVTTVTHYLEALEEVHGIGAGSTAILALVTETPAAVLRMGELTTASLPRLTGVGWGAEDLSSALGAGDPRRSDGTWRPMYVHARSQCILAAHALGVEAIDTVYVNFKDSAGLKTACEESRYDGFTGRFAIHPDQVPVINQAFTPGPEELALAHRIVAAFASGAGAVSLDGKMYDIPHLKAARRLTQGDP